MTSSVGVVGDPLLVVFVKKLFHLAIEVEFDTNTKGELIGIAPMEVRL